MEKDNWHRFASDVDFAIHNYINTHKKEEMDIKKIVEWVADKTGYSIYSIMKYILSEGIISRSRFVEKTIQNQKGGKINE